MPYIPKKQIRRLAGPTIYARGLDYYERGYIKGIQHEQNGTISKVKASVQGQDMYKVELFFLESGEWEDGSCTCPAHIDGMHVCKHMAAVMIELASLHRPEVSSFFSDPAQKKQISEKEATSSLRQFFMDHFSGRLTTVESVGEPMRAEFVLQFLSDYTFAQEKYFSVQLRIGVDKLYVVKNMEELFASIRQRSLLPITKNFTFDPTYHYFKEEDLQSLKMLEYIVRNQKWQKDGRTASFGYSETSPRSIQVPPVAAEQMLERLAVCRQVFIQSAVRNQLVPFMVKEEFPGTFDMQQTDNDYIISYSAVSYPPKRISLTSYYIWNDRLYKIDPEADRDIVLLFHMLMDTPQGRLPLSSEEVGQVYKQIVAPLEQTEKLEMTESIRASIEEQPLQAKIYLDKKENGLTADPLFSYGPYSIHAVTEQQTPEDKAILVRDTKQEKEILQFIEEAGFHWNGERLILSREEDIALFFLDILPELKKQADVFMSRAAESTFIPPETLQVEAALDPSMGWLDISFETSDLNEEDVFHLMKALKEKKRYYKTIEGGYVSLTSSWMKNLQDLLQDTPVTEENTENKRMRMPSYKTLLLDDKTRESTGWNASATMEDLIRHIRDPQSFEVELPERLNADLRDYQKLGFQWMKALTAYGFGGILADDMGLGKTLQTLTYILSERQKNPEAPPFLIVAPSSLIYNWEKEAHRFTPDLKIEVIHGTKPQRKKQWDSYEKADVWITSYPLLRRDEELYRGRVFYGLILDEAQNIKNHLSKSFRAVRRMDAGRIFALSGTPIENKLEELWSMFAVIMPGLFPEVSKFKQLSPDQIKQRIAPFIMRRTKKEVLQELPDKIESSLYCELSKQQRETYMAYLERIKAETSQQLKEGLSSNRMNILANLTRLRQLCCHPGMFLENYTGSSGKLDELMAFMKESKENGRRVLVFSQFTSMLSIISKAFDEAGLSYFYLDGKTPSDQRMALTEKFNEGSADSFLISLKAGGTGLNLTGADTVVLFDLWWNPAVESQAADRAHRIGQKRVVQVVKLISQGTIEEKILSLQDKKKALFDQVIQTGESSLSSLSEDDIRELLDL